RKVPLSEEALDEILAEAPHMSDGSYRASASLFLDGRPMGGFLAEGKRRDDANDLVPHQHRRELRGLKVFAAWLGHTDMKDDNTLSMYVEEDGRHFLRHYLLDFGEALGAHQAEKSRLEDGWEFVFDFEMQTRALVSFGLWNRPWENQVMTPWPVVGAFGAEAFEPELWREAYPYPPFHEVDAADLYWGAKLVMRFDRPMVEAIVHEGQITNPDAEVWLVDALMGRREKIGHAWMEAVTPLDALRMTDEGLCGVDLGVFYGLATDGVVERLPPKYRPDEDRRFEMRDRGVEQFRVAEDGSVCLPIPEDEAYTVDRLRIRRGSEFKPVMQVHYKGGEEPRILGIIRKER
ncbi:MAG: hypothetical protein JRJ84_08700, partial [Deltaproteobacteria bacterium]|nr:hypothetical protein [Deltaproteobacteria bacterium]